MVMDQSRLALCAERGEAELVEIFSSIQGEGPRVGERHLFVRFVHCDIHCAYCDTPLCHAPQAEAQIEQEAGRGRFVGVRNPMPLADIAQEVRRLLGQTAHAAVSLTGGEPLLQPGAICFLAPVIRDAGAVVLLETDGNLPLAFDAVRGSVDVVSLDWKLPSATREPPRYEEHRQILRASRGLEVYVKLVYVGTTPVEEVLEAARAVAAVDPGIPFILQPCTPFARVREAPTPERGMELMEAVSPILTDVRLIPQVHKAFGAR
jgi:organic radical activating enzyme